MKQLDLFRKSKKTKEPETKYKYRSRPHHNHGSLEGLKNDDQMQYYHFPYIISNCQCGQDIRVYYRPEKPELGDYYHHLTTVSPYVSKEIKYDTYYCPKCGRKLYIGNGKIMLIEVIR